MLKRKERMHQSMFDMNNNGASEMEKVTCKKWVKNR